MAEGHNACYSRPCHKDKRTPPSSERRNKRDLTVTKGHRGLPGDHTPLPASLTAASSHPRAGQPSPPDRNPRPPEFQTPLSSFTTSEEKVLGLQVQNFREMRLKRCQPRLPPPQPYTGWWAGGNGRQRPKDISPSNPLSSSQAEPPPLNFCHLAERSKSGKAGFMLFFCSFHIAGCLVSPLIQNISALAACRNRGREKPRFNILSHACNIASEIPRAS